MKKDQSKIKSKYFPKEIETKWQKKWDEEGLYKFSKKTGKKYYNLVELPYPSGDLHIGHWFSFVPPDAHARYKRMSGFDVFFPNGFDAFGLPAENAAIKRGVHPKDWTMKNIETMTKQFATMGTMIDWNYTAITCLPEYYKWNQWIFLKMFEKGIAYRGKALSNWCPEDQTVLANEHIESGKCWRCGSEVIQKEVEQWFLKITDYADELIWQDPPQADWPKQVRDGQNNWIGRSEGVEFDLKVKNSKEKITVFTTRIDTVFGMTYVVIAPEHPFAKDIDSKEVKEYIKQAQKKTEMERKEDRVKSGVFSGKYAINPANEEEVPIWISDYVLAGYGTGAIMAVPGHDGRDSEFAKMHNLNIKEVIIPKVIDKHDPPKEGVKTVFRKAVQVILINPKDNKVLALKWKKFPWVTFITGGVEDGEDLIEAAKREIEEETGYTDVEYIKTLGGPVETHFYANHKKENRKALFSALVFHVKSSRQNEVSKEELDIHSPTWMSFEDLDNDKRIKCSEYEIWKDRLLDNPQIFTHNGVLINSGKYDGLTSEEAKIEITNSFKSEKIARIKVNYHLRDWSVSRQRYWGTPVPIIHCEKCGLVPTPLKDLPIELPYNVDYTPKGKPPLATDEEWLNVKCPSCKGNAKRDAETLDTFFDSAWYYYRYVSPKYKEGPFDEDVVKEIMPVDVYFGGSEHTLGHTLYARFFTKFFKDNNLVFFEEFAQKRVQHGVILGPDGNRMSKSRGNVVSPDDVVGEYGADAVRLYLCFMMPYEATSPWSTGAISGVYRFLKRVWDLQNSVSDELTLTALDYNKMHKTIQKTGDDLNNFQFNTAVASLMTWINYLESKEKVSKEEYSTFLKLIAPFAPHLSEEIWHSRGFSDKSIHLEIWPLYQSKYLIQEKISIAVQVNGKLRDTVQVQSSDSKLQKKVEDEAKSSERVKKYLDKKTIKKVIYVSGRLINFVI